MKKIQISDCGARIVPFTMTTAARGHNCRAKTEEKLHLRESITQNASLARVIKFNSICTFRGGGRSARIIRETYHINQFHVRCRAHFHALSSPSMIDSILIHHQFIIFLRPRLVSSHKNRTEQAEDESAILLLSPRYHFLSTHKRLFRFLSYFSRVFSCLQLQSTRSCTKQILFHRLQQLTPRTESEIYEKTMKSPTRLRMRPKWLNSLVKLVNNKKKPDSRDFTIPFLNVPIRLSLLYSDIVQYNRSR